VKASLAEGWRGREREGQNARGKGQPATSGLGVERDRVRPGAQYGGRGGTSGCQTAAEPGAIRW
jgi:hypothetical protein